jgi:DNA-binding Lrp family transcriptional regulator
MVAPPGAGAAGPWDADALRRLSRLSLDYLVDSIELSRAGGDIIDRLLIAAILDANVAPVKQDVGLQFAYGALDDAPPEEIRRPVSINAVAHSLRLPFETVRRRVARLARQGVFVVTPRGVLVSQTRLESPAFKALSLARYERLRRFYSDLTDAQALPPIPIAGSETVGDAIDLNGVSPPVRVANRVLAEYLMRCIEAVTSRVGHPVDGLLLLHVARANLPPHAAAAGPLVPVRTAVLADLMALSPEVVRRRLRALDRAGFCRRSREGTVLGPAVVEHPAAAALLHENAGNIERLFTRLARLGVLAAWGES